MILQISAKRLSRNSGGRGASKIIIQKDWADLRAMTNEDARGVLTLSPISVDDMKQLDHTLLDVSTMIAALTSPSQTRVREIEEN